MISPGRFILASLMALPFASAALAQATITIRVSFKVIINPANGQRPPNGGPLVSDNDIIGSVAQANQLLGTYWRGYRLQIVDPITNIGTIGANARPDPAWWYNSDWSSTDSGVLNRQRDDMQSDALNNPQMWRWNYSAINFYILPLPGAGGLCSFPNAQIVLISGNRAEAGNTLLHEMGHFFGLCHTHGCSDAACDNNVGSDNIADTIDDQSCWNQDQIAQWNFGQQWTYASLPGWAMNDVDNVFRNIMSYHDLDNRVRMTEAQVDRLSHIGDESRGGVLSGRTVVLQTNATWPYDGTFSHPYNSITQALNESGVTGNDIMLLRPGTYNAGQFIQLNTPLVLRAPRAGSARIGG